MHLDALSSPTNVHINETVYGENYSNVTLVWTPPVAPGRGRLAHYNVYLKTQIMMKEFQVSMAVITLHDVPYNEEITASITAENCFAESERTNFTFVTCKKFIYHYRWL